MHFRILFAVASAAACCIGADRPAGMSVHTWVREDLFAGYMANDLVRFEKGVEKVDRILEATPNDPVALVWKGSSEVYRATLARRAGNSAEYCKLLDRGMARMAKARELAPDDVGVNVVSAAPLLFADRLEDADRRPALELGRKTTLHAIELQSKVMDQLPVHFRGELWSSMAFSSDRLGEKAMRDEYLSMMIAKLPGTSYETRARKWLDNGTLATGTFMCLSCHEPGRYEPVLKRLPTPKN